MTQNSTDHTPRLGLMLMITPLYNSLHLPPQTPPARIAARSFPSLPPLNSPIAPGATWHVDLKTPAPLTHLPQTSLTPQPLGTLQVDAGLRAKPLARAEPPTSSRNAEDGRPTSPFADNIYQRPRRLIRQHLIAFASLLTRRSGWLYRCLEEYCEGRA